MFSRKAKTAEMPEVTVEVNEKPVESDYVKSLRVMRDFIVTFGDGTNQTITANRFHKTSGNRSDAGEVTFEGTPDSPYASIAYFRDVVSVVPVPARVYPAPIKGVEYYTLEDMRQALVDLGYHDTDLIVRDLGKKLSLRDDGRYTLSELQESYKQIDHVSGDYITGKLKDAALQARKNRVFQAHNGS